jgi:hypothetical protein
MSNNNKDIMLHSVNLVVQGLHVAHLEGQDHLNLTCHHHYLVLVTSMVKVDPGGRQVGCPYDHLPCLSPHGYNMQVYLLGIPQTRSDNHHPLPCRLKITATLYHLDTPCHPGLLHRPTLQDFTMVTPCHGLHRPPVLRHSLIKFLRLTSRPIT